MEQRQVFISYSHADDKFVELFIKRLQQAFPSLKIWYDRTGLLGGDKWWDAILKAIAVSDIFIYILSNESVTSVYCQAEFTEARRLQKRIITIQARDRTEQTDELDDIQFIDMTEGADSADGLVRLTAAVNEQLRLTSTNKAPKPLWKPATPKPLREEEKVRPADAPESIQTVPLAAPTAEIMALKLAEKTLNWQIFSILATAILGVITIGVSVWLGLMNANSGSALPTPTAQTIVALLTDTATQTTAATLTATFTPTDTPTATNTPTATDTPTHTPTHTFTPSDTPTATPNPTEIEETVAAEMRLIASESTLSAAQTQTAAAEFSIRDQTATARLWTPTATIDARGTAQARVAQTATQEWIVSWTDTPTATLTPSKTATPTVTPTATRTPTSTNTATSTPTRTATPTATQDLTLTAIVESTQRAQGIQVRVINGPVNLRLGPGTDYARIGAAQTGTIYTVLAEYQRAGKWYLVNLETDDSQTADSAWIRNDFVVVLEGFEGIIVPTAAQISPTPIPAPTSRATATPTTDSSGGGNTGGGGGGGTAPTNPPKIGTPEG